MTDNAPPQATSKADLRLAYLERLSKAQLVMESAVKSKYITPRSLFKRPSNRDTLPNGVDSAGGELVECINSKALHLRESIENATTFPNDAWQHIERFLGVLEESTRRMKSSLSGLHWDGSSIEKTTRRCHQNVETAWKELISSLSPLTTPPGGPDVQETEGPLGQGHLGRSGESLLQTQSPKPKTEDPAELEKADPVGQDNVTDSDSEGEPAWTKALEPSRIIFKYVGAAAPSIPVVGNFIKCGVDVGNAVVDMLDGTAQNTRAIRRLSKKVTRLSSMVAVFEKKERSYCATELGMQHLKEFGRICVRLKADIDDLRSQHPARKFVLSNDNTGSIKTWSGKLDDALGQLDLYLRLNADHMLNDLGEARLVDLLGDGYYGNKGYKNEDGFCLEGTREEVLLSLDAWANGASSSNLLLLRGQAGRGKSTIAKTAAKRYASRGESTAVFFFRRGEKGLNERPVRALARQLVRKGESLLRNAILQAINENQDVAFSSLEDQLRILLVEPLEKLKSDPPPVMLVIDALDECGEEAYSSSLLRIIAKHSPSLPPTTKILITCRPEQNIVPLFEGLIDRGAIEDLDGVDTGVNTDLRTYFEDRLSAIGRQRGLRPGWQGGDAADQLVSRAQGLFQWASTAMKLVSQETEPNYGLQMLLNLDSSDIGLYTLYRQILEAAFPDNSRVSKELVQYVLGSLVASPSPMSQTTLIYLWEPPPNTHRTIDVGVEIQAGILNRLRSLFMIPTSPNEPIRFLHTSIRDFLAEEKQRHDFRFFVDAAQHSHQSAMACLERMKKDLAHFDIGAICGPAQTSAEVQDAFRRKVTSGLVYCARSWSACLSQVPHNELCLRLLDEFCRTNLIHWMEILSLAEVAHEIILMTGQGKDWVCQSETYAKTSELLDDAQRLCRQSFEIIATRPYHISRSVLLHCPLKTALRHFHNLGSGTPHIKRGPIHTRWPNNLWTKFIGAAVYSVAFSPDGRTIASGSGDCTIRLWNVESGAQIGAPLTGYTQDVNTVAFSPDGKTIASGSDDGTVRLWSVADGVQIGPPLTGHTKVVWEVAFSPDGKTVVSGSGDSTIRLWSVENGAQIGAPFTGHIGCIHSVAFSRDSKTIASGSRDCTIRLWGINSGTQVRAPLTGHTDDVNTVAFSPNGKTIASGSDDRTVRLWGVETGVQIGAPLTGHTGPIRSVAFSRDGKTVASGSDDNTVRLWSAESGALIRAPLNGLTGWVRSIAFSSDDNTIVSGSDDMAIRLWNAEGGVQINASLTGHTDVISRVAFSRDRQTIVSKSTDGAARLWNVASGMQIEQVKSNEVKDLSFFEPDLGALMASDGQRIDLHGSGSGRDMVGWVTRDGVRWFWLPREWYVSPGAFFDEENLGISFSNNVLVIHHPHIHILDVLEAV